MPCSPNSPLPAQAATAPGWVRPDLASRGNFGERQESGRHDWGYYAHLSIYAFAAECVRGRRCLEIGCGTGYGAQYLEAEGGAASVVAIDKDESQMEELRARFPTITFLARDLDLGGLNVAADSVDVVFSSNVFEHLAYPDPVLAAASNALAKDGMAIIAVPPIMTVGMLAENAKNVFHINNLPTWAWTAKLGRYFQSVSTYRHWVRADRIDGQGAILRDRPSLADFVFTEDDSCNPSTITAVFVCHGPRRSPLPAAGEAETCPPEWRSLKVEADARQEMVTDLRRELAAAAAWARENTQAGTDPRFILEGVCRQLKFLSG